jgi:hypothetical protein
MNTIEVELPESFDNKHLFTTLFSSETKTGGGVIDELNYLPDELKAIIRYNDDKVAQNVLNKREIVYCDFKFIIKEHHDNKLKEANPFEQRKSSIDKRRIRLLGIHPDKTSNDVERFAFCLTQSNPVKSRKDENGSWQVFFETEIDLVKTEQNFKRKKKSLPAKLQYKVVYTDEDLSQNLATDTSNNRRPNESFLQDVDLHSHSLDNWSRKEFLLKNLKSSKGESDAQRYAYMLTNLLSISAVKKSDQNGIWLITYDSDLDFSEIEKKYQYEKYRLPPGLHYEKVTCKSVANLNHIYKNSNFNNTIASHTSPNQFQVTKSLKNNTFLSMILNDRNQPWKRELFQLIENEKVTTVIIHEKSIFKVVFTSNSSFRTEQYCDQVIDKIIANYFCQFHLELIESNNENDMKNLTKAIDEIRKVYLIEYLNKSNKNSNKLYIMGLRNHVKDFFERNQSLRKLSNLYAVENDSKIRDSLKIPILKNDKKIFNKTSLINMILPEVQRKHGLDSSSLNSNDIEIRGQRKRV